MPPWDDSSLPVIATTANIGTTSVSTNRLIKFTASGAARAVVPSGDWIVVVNSTSSTAAGGIQYASSNSYVSMTGSSYDYALGVGQHYNSRAQGVAGSSGNRRGLAFGNTTSFYTNCTAIGFGIAGASSVLTTAGQAVAMRNCTIVGGAAGILFAASGTLTAGNEVNSCLITGSSGYGINAGVSHVTVLKSRLRDHTSGNITNLGNYPIDINLYDTDSDDTTEFVDAAGGDYRIKYGAATWGQGYGAGDEPAPSGGGGGGTSVTIQ
jgi:hypothetical protein